MIRTRFLIWFLNIYMIQYRDITPFVRQFFEISDAQRRNVLQLFDRDKQRRIIREDVDTGTILVISR